MARSDIDSDTARHALAGMRLAMGTSAILAPRMLGRAFGLDPERNPAAPLIARMFGARNVAIGIRLFDAQGEELDYWLQAGVAVDAFDAIAVVVARARGYVPTRTAVLGLAAALSAVAAGVQAREN